MTDVIDGITEREEHILELRLASHLEVLSREQIEKIVRQGRECSECGLPIPAARLRAMPHAHRCIECQEWGEKKR